LKSYLLNVIYVTLYNIDVNKPDSLIFNAITMTENVIDVTT
jgi:hypothetical protein